MNLKVIRIRQIQPSYFFQFFSDHITARIHFQTTSVSAGTLQSFTVNADMTKLCFKSSVTVKNLSSTYKAGTNAIGYSKKKEILFRLADSKQFFCQCCTVVIMIKINRKIIFLLDCFFDRDMLNSIKSRWIQNNSVADIYRPDRSNANSQNIFLLFHHPVNQFKSILNQNIPCQLAKFYGFCAEYLHVQAAEYSLDICSENKNSYDLRGLISNFENDRIPAADFCKLFLTFLYNSLLHELCHNIGHCGFGKASPPRKFNSRITGSRSDQLKDQSPVELFGCYAVLAISFFHVYLHDHFPLQIMI